MKLDNDKFALANELIKATSKMSAREHKTFFFACTVREEGERTIRVPYSELCRKLNISRGGKTDKLFAEAWDRVMTKDNITIPKEYSRTGKSIKGHIISSIVWDENEVEINFEENFLPFLDNLKSNHTWLYLEQLAKLDKEYAPRFYAFFKMILRGNRHMNYRWYIDTRGDKDVGLKEFLGIEEVASYKRFNNLRQRIIEPSIREINEKSSDISVGWSTYYKGRNAIAIDLRIYSSSALPVTDPMHTEHKDTIIQDDERIERINEDFDENCRNLNWWDG